MNRPFTNNPYPAWYRNLPIVVFLPWRNLGCLGIRVFGLYMDVYRRPNIGMFVTWRNYKRYPIAAVRRWWARHVGDHVESVETDLVMYYYHHYATWPTRWHRRYARLCAYGVVAWRLPRYRIGAMICRRYGHSTNTECRDFVNAERDVRGRITDIDGGGVDWYCPRCGQGGRSWF